MPKQHKCPKCGTVIKCTFLSEAGTKGGKKSKRKITPEQQAKMQDARRRRKEE